MKVKLFFNYLLQFCVSVLFFLLVLLTICRFTIFNSNYMFKLLEKTNYYDTVYDSIADEMENYLVQSGFDDEVIDDIYTKDQVRSDVNTMIEKIYNNESYTIETAAIETQLQENINSFLDEHNITINDKTSINNFAKEIVGVYKSKVDVFNKISFVGKILNLGQKYLFVAVIILAILVVVMNVILIKGFKKNVLPIMFFTSMFLLLASSIYFGNRIDVEHINLYNNYVSTLLSTILKNFIVHLRVIGIASGIVGLFTILVEKMFFAKKGKK